ncbi:uncharacterized protein ATNIH1004_001979 [Aspergillus tanneri]|uniref:Uncharacterized protein n=1 Tax=Aspergillus tanneri TaxID=1220188 RepID=A0A5M9MEF0_9EURO|nr:uncharacterized protein ATNIH1004_001979 [Aspergillus tanneri]KAA8641377.1 hypothetical protein ATNIH1004_001979 [Aspergillus tanneri]
MHRIKADPRQPEIFLNYTAIELWNLRPRLLAIPHSTKASGWADHQLEDYKIVGFIEGKGRCYLVVPGCGIHPVTFVYPLPSAAADRSEPMARLIKWASLRPGPPVGVTGPTRLWARGSAYAGGAGAPRIDVPSSSKSIRKQIAFDSRCRGEDYPPGGRRHPTRATPPDASQQQRILHQVGAQNTDCPLESKPGAFSLSITIPAHTGARAKE